MNVPSHDEIISEFEEIANGYNRSNQYFDILYDSLSSIFIEKTPSSENVSVNAKRSGVVARTYIGEWKEFAIPDGSAINKIIPKIPKVSGKGDAISEFPGWKLVKEIKPKIDPSSISIDDKLERIRDIYNYVMNYDDKIVNCKVKYLELKTIRTFVNNEGSRLHQSIPRMRIFIIPIAKEGSIVDFDYFSTEGQIGYEIFDEIENSKMEEIVNNSLEMLKAEPIKAGKYPTILDPPMTGITAHESFGHGLEADQILRDRSYLKERLNKKVASDICVICDTPALKGQWGSIYFDDEGVRPGKNVLVENGILKDFIYDRRSASILGAEPKGNGRRESYAHPIHPRMTTTYFERGETKLDEMISDIKLGVIMHRGYFGMEDPLGGGMQCTSKKGYLIENGQKTKILKSMTISGSVLDVLQNIDAISSDNLEFGGGTCGKGMEDYVPVSDGGTYIRIKSALLSPG